MTEPRRHGCYSPPPRKRTVLVQDGWIVVSATNGQATRLPRMVELPDPMTTDCGYIRNTPDGRCTGCNRNPAA